MRPITPSKEPIASTIGRGYAAGMTWEDQCKERLRRLREDRQSAARIVEGLEECRITSRDKKVGTGSVDTTAESLALVKWKIEDLDILIACYEARLKQGPLSDLMRPRTPKQSVWWPRVNRL